MFELRVLVTVQRDNIRTAGASMLTSVTLAVSAIKKNVKTIVFLHSCDNVSLFFVSVLD